LRRYRIQIPIDSIERTVLHKEIINKKKFLKKLYIEWYSQYYKYSKKILEGLKVEIGSGGGFLKEFDHTIICSDILKIPNLDMNFSALQMPFDNESVGALFMIDAFHHIPDSKKFLEEAYRVLLNKGRVIMIEPANSFWSRLVYKNFHNEPFDLHGDWKIKGNGPLSGANGALPWIVFERDKEKFSEYFPNLEIKRIEYHTPFRYLLSGGLQYHNFVPNWSFGIFTFVDKVLSAVSKQISMFVTIVVEKKQ
jgi:SAM-dependent methyltransferase